MGYRTFKETVLYLAVRDLTPPPAHTDASAAFSRGVMLQTCLCNELPLEVKEV